MENQLVVFDGYGFFGTMLIGFLAGYIANKAMKRNYGFLISILLGIAGAFVGTALAQALSFKVWGFASNLIAATAGAIIILWVFDLLNGKRSK